MSYGAYEPSEATMAQWVPRVNQVVIVESIAPLVALHALGERIRGTNLLVFVDNTTTEGAFVKGLSGLADIDETAGAFWAQCVDSDVAPYIDRAPTDANPGDDPSRSRFTFLEAHGATRIDITPPTWLVDASPWEAHLGSHP